VSPWPWGLAGDTFNIICNFLTFLNLHEHDDDDDEEEEEEEKEEEEEQEDDDDDDDGDDCNFLYCNHQVHREFLISCM
jgi:hypothetical protein